MSIIAQSAPTEQPADIQPAKPKLILSKKYIIILVIVIFIISIIGIVSIISNNGSSSNQNATQTPSPAPPSPTITPVLYEGEFTVTLKENAKDKAKTDIFLHNKQSGEDTFFITLTDVLESHPHAAEFHNGNLYIVLRPGGLKSYLNNPRWTDELWRYNTQKEGEKLYSLQNLDFRISRDEEYIAVTDPDTIIILNSAVEPVRTIEEVELKNVLDNIAYPFSLFAWGDDSLWIKITSGTNLNGFVKIDRTSFGMTYFNLSGLSIAQDYEFNIKTQKIVFSNYPVFLNLGEAERYKQSKSKVTLNVYDLNTQQQQRIATSIAKHFQPKWISDTTIEYNYPNGTGRIKEQVVKE